MKFRGVLELLREIVVLLGKILIELKEIRDIARRVSDRS